ncbi:PKD domain-containing protein, partial [Arthrospira platensis SPKY2]
VSQVVITVLNVNKTPVADAGSDQSVLKGALVTLDGTASTDPDGDQLTYKWTAPAGITLSSTTVAKPTFTAPNVSADTDYIFTLVVSDGTLESEPVEVKVTVKYVNAAPIANAGS